MNMHNLCYEKREYGKYYFPAIFYEMLSNIAEEELFKMNLIGG